MIRFAQTWSPVAVCLVWATILALNLETRGVTIAGRILLGLTLGLHIRQEFHEHRLT
jgi:hypothetical protein